MMFLLSLKGNLIYFNLEKMLFSSRIWNFDMNSLERRPITESDYLESIRQQGPIQKIIENDQVVE